MSDEVITDENLMTKKTYARLLSLLSEGELRARTKISEKSGKRYFALSFGETIITDRILCDAINSLYEAKKTKDKEIIVDGVVYIPKESNDE